MCHESEHGYRDWDEWIDAVLSDAGASDDDTGVPAGDIGESDIGQYEIEEPALEPETLDCPELND